LGRFIYPHCQSSLLSHLLCSPLLVLQSFPHSPVLPRSPVLPSFSAAVVVVLITIVTSSLPLSFSVDLSPLPILPFWLSCLLSCFKVNLSLHHDICTLVKVVIHVPSWRDEICAHYLCDAFRIVYSIAVRKHWFRGETLHVLTIVSFNPVRSYMAAELHSCCGRRF
jgi:hypothetical protein